MWSKVYVVCRCNENFDDLRDISLEVVGLDDVKVI